VKDLLFLSHRIPYPPDKGDKIRAWHMLRELSRSHRIHLGCFIDDQADTAHVDTLRQHCAELYCRPIHKTRRKLRSLRALSGAAPLTIDYFADAKLQAWVDQRLATGIDRAFVYCSAMAPYLMGATEVRRVLDMVDVDSAKWSAYATAARGPARLIWSREAKTLLEFERRAVTAFDQTLFVSEAEAACFARLAPDCAGRISAMPNGVDLAQFAPAQSWPTPYAEGTRNLVFTGAMDYRPNVDAMLWFAAEVMPRLAAPELHLTIVGANPSPAIARLAGPRITVTGRVPDVRPYLAHADAAVAPLRIARGIQNKVLEAMAMGRIVIASPEAHEGIGATAGRDLLVAATAPAMADTITAVLAGAYPDIGGAARQAMERHHDWRQTLSGLPDLFEPDPHSLLIRKAS
jgi:sugar transferase (PEP-CTERM/EpsH1 system associated)